MTTGALRSRQTIAVGGRRLCFAQWGDPEGAPVFALHGTPGGRLNRHPDERVYAAVGARVITYDRPGYGGSSRMEGRSVVDAASDVAVLADHLGIGLFAVTGSSGGAPHALAVAARLGERVVRARCNVGIVPYGLDGFDFYAGMEAGNVEEFEWAVEGETRLVPRLERKLREIGERVAADPAKLLGDDRKLDDADRAVLSRPDMAALTRETTKDLVVGGVWGWVDDDLAFVHQWGFDVSEIAVPVRVTYGQRDVLVPAAHGAWLGRNIPGATVIVDPSAGHMSDLNSVAEATRWLVSGDTPT
jgi:pimeloyl-ACP methyl ester carboxylesterase